jgi:AcrR family transcriptional regulator
MSETTTVARRRRADGEKRREAILSTAARLATVDGIDGLSIGRLAEELGMSKSGLYAHFDSKQDLQLATIDTARQIFIEVVILPAMEAPRGVEQLRALCLRFLEHIDQKVFPGGCFFAAVAAEVAARPGDVRDRIAREQLDWIALIERIVAEARDLGELTAHADPAQLAFELNALLIAANTAFVLHANPAGLERARRAVDRLLISASP